MQNAFVSGLGVLGLLAIGSLANAEVVELDRRDFNDAIAGLAMHVEDFESFSAGAHQGPLQLANGLQMESNIPWIASGPNGQVLMDNFVPLTEPRTFTGFADGARYFGIDVLFGTQDEYDVAVETAAGAVLQITARRGSAFDGFFGVQITDDSIVRVTFTVVGGPGGPGGDGGGIGNYAFDNAAVDAVVAPCPEDLDGSGVVDLGDLSVVLFNFGLLGGPGDVTGDGLVDLADLSAVLFAFGQACP
ncbi:MAG: hypothetical protein KDA20_03835 [Phycisphaerales bacterium]|nr:hypothetical protein [Phycisphaerales bacterium]